MVLPWTVSPVVLYAEIAITFFLLLSWFRPILWNKLASSRLITSVSKYFEICSIAFLFVLTILFADAEREVTKLIELEDRIEINATYHMHLLRAKKNVYVSGLSIIFLLVIRHIMKSLRSDTQTEVAKSVAMLQTENECKTARTLANALLPKPI
ncbi:hypothetical protein CAEBREN_18135 [Caenorhabditis brenneri]|uniref:BAP29/BAP31 transmembrane domain-containing protein n=1 Tax=Caenorhabditis brenneri TaxID=135651 RepID=G0P4L3_CAEBE|nr:hypothetical protein CAEBREN_18135 [Caenorhabditis brenneri]